MTLIVAPAGFGKTVALREYLVWSGLEAVRYDVHREDATLTLFAHGLATALESLVPGAAASFSAMQQRLLGEEDQLAILTDWFVEHLRNVVGTVVIDDLHHAARDARVVPLVVSLIERTSGRVKWFLASRSDAGLPLASWLAYGRIDIPIGEEDLRFSVDEAIGAAADEALDEREIEALRNLTGGWPVALTLALHARMHASDLQATASGTRDLLYRYLAEQIFNELNEGQRAALLRTCIVPSFDAALIEALGIDVGELHELRRQVSFLSETAPGVYCYHDLFRDFLEAQLQSEGMARWTAVHEEVAGALSALGDDLSALRLYTAAGCSSGIVDVLRRSGTSLFERGEAETLEGALARLDGSQRLDSSVLGVKAMLEAARGHFELAERDFIDAIERAEEESLRVALVHRYAIESIRHERDAIALLEPYLARALPANLRVPMLATYATALARAGRLDDAVESVSAGIAAIDGSVDDDARARFYQQAAFVHHLLPSRGHAWNYANLAIELALKRGMYEVAARAYSVLYIIVYDEEDDPMESLLLLDRLIECARKAGSVQTRLYGLMASFEIQVERGDDFAVERLESEMERASGGVLAQTRGETLLPARAMRSASEGDFQHAFALLDGTGEAQGSTERRALREAEIALYAYASGQTAQAETARGRAAEALAQCANLTRRATRTRVMLALAELIRGHSASAHRYISEAERAGSLRSRRLRSLVHAARVLYRFELEQVGDDEVAAALERLNADQFGGLARMLSALPFAHDAQLGNYALLTPAERGILAALARGATSKDVAAESGRSAQTVDTHIRSICRKLRCSGRREAIALAIRSGWVET